MARKKRQCLVQEQTQEQVGSLFPDQKKAIYAATLSVKNSKINDDGDSIEDQVEIFRDYVVEYMCLSMADTYVYSGSTRDYIEASNLLENIFPNLGVQFITEVDCYNNFETDGYPSNLYTSIKNWLTAYVPNTSPVNRNMIMAEKKPGIISLCQKTDGTGRTAVKHFIYRGAESTGFGICGYDQG